MISGNGSLPIKLKMMALHAHEKYYRYLRYGDLKYCMILFSNNK